MKKGTVITLVVVGVLLLFVFWGVGMRNGLVNGEENVKAAWSQVENQYQRRADLIPNLVSTVKGYAAHESETLESVIAARNLAATSGDVTPESVAKSQEAENQVTSAISRLMVVVERYPDLKANENFLELQAQLEGTENRIAVERKRFNDTARAYNIKVRRFPNNIIANMSGFEQYPYFEATAGSNVAPVVEF